MEVFKKIKAKVLANATVKGKVTSVVGLIILLRWAVTYISTGAFNFTEDAPMLIFGVFLFTIEDPNFIKDLVKKLL
jgi:hypothetical protein